MSLATISEKIYKASAKDNINYLISKSASNPIGLTESEISALNFYLRKKDGVQTLANAANVDAEEVLDILDDRTAYQELELKAAGGTKGGATKFADERKFYSKAESWITKNASRYEDPEKFKKAFKRTFPKNNFLLEAINSEKGKHTVQFSDNFKKEIFGTGEGFTIGGRSQRIKTGLSKISDISFAPKTLNEVFKVAIYNFNPSVRNKIINEFKNIVPTGRPTDKELFNIKKSIENNNLFKKFGVNKSIKGPIARLLYKDLGETLSKEISTLRQPRIGTVSLLRILKDRVNSKYKKQFEEAISAVDSALRKDIPEAKKKLKIAENINFDHKIPKSFINAGYADEINFIKLNPTLESFNLSIKNNEFDKPMIALARRYEAASTKNKGKILKDMEDLKSNFNKKYSNYLSDVSIKDVKGKPFFESTDVPLSKSNILDKFKTLYKSATTGSPIKKYLEKNIAHCADGCFIKVANKNPERIAKKLAEDPKLIRLFRGESFPQRNVKALKETAKQWGTTFAEMKKDTLSGQWYTPTQGHASSYLSRPGQMKYVDVTPQELEAFNRYKARVNKRPVKYSTKKKLGLADPPTHGVTGSFHHQIIPRYKLKEMEKAGRLKTKWDLNPFGARSIGRRLVEHPKGVLEWDSVLGGFVDSANPSEVVGQNQLKAWAQDNPMPVKVGEAAPGILKKTGKALAHLGLPLPTAAMDAYFIGREIEEGKSPEEIARNPLNWLGLATMDPLTKIAGVAEKSGKLASIMRLGMSPGLIRGATRFLGLPGLALSTGLTAYDQYQKYKQKEGFVYNLFNPEEIDNAQV